MKSLLTIIFLLISTLALSAQIVYRTEFRGEADKKVYVIEFKGEADMKVYFTEFKGEADLIVYYTEFKGEAGPRKR